jgi:single-strand DNA-binding protein
MATNDSYRNDKGEKVDQTEWHRVVAWGKTAEIIEKFVTKGTQVALEGKLTNRSYDDKNGEKRYITEVVVSAVHLFGK